MYRQGKGVPQDYKTAVKWYRLAAEKGDADAQTNLGTMYDNGRGVPEDNKTAVKWYRLAVEQGNANAQFNLGNAYGRGHGVIQDNVYAHMWLNIAASFGESKSASKNRDIVAKRMTPSQLEKAQDLARECVRKKYKGC
jgi:TPR repeat protein